MHAAITSYFDVAQITLYLFWGFLAAVIYYLHAEDKREGYPLESERSSRIKVQGFPAIPSPKTFLLADGTTVQAPRAEPHDSRPIEATPLAGFLGAPLVPDGDPMVDGVGPAAYAERRDIPDVTIHGTPKLIPLRTAPDWHIDHNDPDPRGMPVIGLDGKVGGTVKDVWLDRAESIIRYFEIEVAGPSGPRNVLLPTTMSRISYSKREVLVRTITAAHFAKVPGHKNSDFVTRLEEDKICAYYAGGHLYATAARSEPLT
jgi:photosynthetic reaction center H subunit